MDLSEQQERALNLALDGENLFITGSGGVGKSHLIQVLIEELKQDKKLVYLTASTGIAAVNIGGLTLHAFAGLGLATESVDELVKKVRFSKKVMRRWNCDVLIIDEISMVDPIFFSKLNQIAKRVRRFFDRPFGGIQLICTGDFFQLPPVQAEAAPFLFETDTWQECQFKLVQLTKVFRQSDETFISVLEKIRWGEIDEQVKQMLLSRTNVQLDCSDGILPTKLHSTNAQVDRINMQALEALEGPSYTFEYRQKTVNLNGDEKKRICAKVLQDCRAEAELVLKVGAQVILLSNLAVEMGLCNGSRGVVVGFVEQNQQSLPVVRFTNGIETCVLYYIWQIKSPDGWTVHHSQIPLKLAYALTIHKCIVGSTLLSTANGMIHVKNLFPSEQECCTSLSANITVYGEKELKTATELYKGFVEKTYRLTTVHGYMLRGSERHPVRMIAVNKHQWRRIPELRMNDVVVLRVGVKAEGSPIPTDTYTSQYPDNKTPPTVSPQMCYFLGNLSALLKINGKTMTVFHNQHHLIHAMADYLQQEFDVLPMISSNGKKKHPETTLTIESEHLKEFLKWTGLVTINSDVKAVPWVVLQNTLESQKEFVRGFYTINGNNTETEISSVYFFANDIEFLRDFHCLLLNLGVVSKIRQSSGFMHAICCVKSSISILKSILNLPTTIENEVNADSSYNTIPFGKSIAELLLQELEAKHDIVPSPIKTLLNDWVLYNTNITKADVEFLQSHVKLEQLDSAEILLDFINNNYLYDVVKEIKSMPAEQLYDLVVPDGHDFIGNGFVNHNSQGMTLDRVELELSRVFADGQAYVALSRARSLEGTSIIGLNMNRIKANPRVIEFYKQFNG